MKNEIDRVRAFNRFYTNFLGLLNEKLLGKSVSLTEGRILFEIDKYPDCNARDLMELLRIDKGYLSRTLSRLEQSGFLKKNLSKKDKRARILSLTTKGEKLLDGINRNATSEIKNILKALRKSEREGLVSAMLEIETILSNANQ